MSVLDAPTADVAAYAADVRRALTGLTPEQVDDLTDDLEQALADALADDHRSGAGVGLVGLFGTPQQYADDLRAAAGLDAAEPGTTTRSFARAATQARADLLAGLAPLFAQPWWPGFAAFARTLEPLWWVLRGWVMYVIPAAVFGLGVVPRGFVSWVLLLALVVVSVQWGRGLWRGHRVTRWLWRASSVLALVLALPLLASGLDSGSADSSGGYDSPPQPSDGVYVGGRPVSNLFVYDADGKQVAGAQVFDQDGRPVTTTTDDTGYWYDELDGTSIQLVPATAADGAQRWNVYPMRTQEWNELDPEVLDPAVDARWPFAQAGAVLTPGLEPTGDAASSPAAAPQPNASAAPDASATPNASATPDASATPEPTPSATD
ncbi:hypothetical protein [Cellulomonas sp. PhB150]|uniref:hypothetical protein n=1 Tax=Cellulomonas sp. PhB150 TaxID=2485188 RepID=UPI000F4777F0|nr:hypothetical protein [Cellulomonas sp. PhB150]ROS22996.1 hypothetical protein EDF34_3171 [Cellulomonas sp. PhB150]